VEPTQVSIADSLSAFFSQYLLDSHKILGELDRINISSLYEMNEDEKVKLNDLMKQVKGIGEAVVVKLDSKLQEML
jgi:hypothetical protein